jgi:hypothetical protein
MTSLATVADVIAAAAKLEHPVVHVDLRKGSCAAEFRLGEQGAPPGEHVMARHVFNQLRKNAYVDTHIDKVLLSEHHRAYPVRAPDGQAIQAAEEDGA